MENRCNSQVSGDDHRLAQFNSIVLDPTERRSPFFMGVANKVAPFFIRGGKYSNCQCSESDVREPHSERLAGIPRLGSGLIVGSGRDRPQPRRPPRLPIGPDLGHHLRQLLQRQDGLGIAPPRLDLAPGHQIFQPLTWCQFTGNGTPDFHTDPAPAPCHSGNCRSG